MPRDAVDLLLTSDLLRGVSEAQLRAIAPPPEWVALAAGETLIRQGEPGAAFYFLVHGRLRVFVEHDGQSHQVGEVQPGEGVGEMALLTGEPTSATVRVMHDSSLIRFSRESYLQLMESCPEAALHVMRMVIKRLRRQGIARTRRAPSFATIAVVPLDPDIDTARFVASLAEQLAPLRPAIAIGLNSLDPEHATLVRRTQRLAPEDEHAITARLIELECARPSTMIYEALAAPVEWTRIAIRQTDLVLLLTTVDADPALRPHEDAFINYLECQLAPRTDLVVLHPEQWREACGTRRWLEPRTITEWHHLRCWQAEDFARLARVLSGSAICLVLGGGGARGLAEIGVLRALREAGVPIDRVGGTSMGSIIGAMVALGYSIEQMTAIHREIWLERYPLSDYTFPAMSIIRGRRLHNLTRELFADQLIEDLPIPYFCISANLTNADQIVHDRGPLWQGVRASSSLPGTGPPLFLDGNVLIDGGVLNNLPVDVMRARHGGFVIGVDVSREQAMTVPCDLEQVPSGGRLLWNRLNPFRQTPRLPNIFEILYRTATLNACRWANVTRGLVDLAIIPPVSRIGTLEFKPFDAIIEAGYREAVRVLRGARDAPLGPYLRAECLPDIGPEPEPAPVPAPHRHHPLPRPFAIALTLFAILPGLGRVLFRRAFHTGHRQRSAIHTSPDRRKAV
jgi:NTE family protein